MSRKPDGTERSGRGTAPSAAGGFGGADTALSRLARPFVPKPFRSLGGMSASADTMLSIGMGRHNNDDELPEDQVNIAGIVDRKVSDRRYLPRKLKNMQYYLHTTPINEALSLSDEDLYRRISAYERDLHEDLSRLEKIKKGVAGLGSIAAKAADILDPALQVAAAVLPFGELYFGYRAYQNFEDVQTQIKKIQDDLQKYGLSIDLKDDSSSNSAQIQQITIKSPAERAILKSDVIKIAVETCNFLSDIFKAIPFDSISGLQTPDTFLDLSMLGLSAGVALSDPSGEEVTEKLFEFTDYYKDRIDQLERFLKFSGRVAAYDADDVEKTLEISNVIENLALIYKQVDSTPPDASAAGSLAQMGSPTTVSEARRKKKKKTDEMSMTGNVAGFTGPVAGPKRPKQFYDTMARAAGGEYLIDPVKNLKSKP